MTPQDLLEKYKTRQGIADALGVTLVAVHYWFQRSGKVPMRRQYQVEKLTRGRLKADSEETV